MRATWSRLFGLLVLLLPLTVPLNAHGESPDLGEAVRKAILRLPYYGPFDLISFQVSDGVVTLGGEVYLGVLKNDAEEAVRQVPGVGSVVNQIEVLPGSIEDDRLRRAVFRKIYTDNFLSRYGSSGGLLGHRTWGRGLGGAAFRGAGPFLHGLEPAGKYAVHVIVSGGRVTLYGSVDNGADRDKAVMDARGVFGVREVDSEIQVREK